jgi:hypothetical protein
MSSVQSHIKQQRIVYGALPTSGNIKLNTFTRVPFDPSNPNSTSGTFALTGNLAISDSSAGLTPIFRDMGEVIRSAGRTFRRVQQLVQSPSTFGVTGAPSTGASVSDYVTYWYEVSLLDGQGPINALFQVQG